MPSSLFLGENIFLKFRYRILNDQEVAPPPQFWRSMYKNWSEIKEKEVYAPPCIISLLWSKLFIMQLNKFEREICMFRNIKHCLKLKCWLKKILIINLKNYYYLKKNKYNRNSSNVSRSLATKQISCIHILIIHQ